MKSTTVEQFLKDFNKMYDVVCHITPCLKREMIYCTGDCHNIIPNSVFCPSKIISLNYQKEITPC